MDTKRRTERKMHNIYPCKKLGSWTDSIKVFKEIVMSKFARYLFTDISP